MANLEFQREQHEALKATYRLFGQGDLMKFFLFEEHRYIYKPVNYFPIYEKWFSPYRGKDIVFVEVGVQNGGSAQMWKHYFGKSAHIVGVDINPACKQVEEEQITVEIGSQEDPNFWAAFKEKYPRVDILLDDGGLYMCEDCGTSYWKEYGGGLKNPASFIEFVKNFVDEINASYTQGEVPSTYNTLNMGGVHFYGGIVIAEKSRLPFKPFSLLLGETKANH